MWEHLRINARFKFLYIMVITTIYQINWMICILVFSLEFCWIIQYFYDKILLNKINLLLMTDFTYQINIVIPNSSHLSIPNESPGSWANSLLLLQNSIIINYMSLSTVITHWKKSDVEMVEPSFESLIWSLVKVWLK